MSIAGGTAVNVVFEFFGVARLRSGVERIAISAEPTAAGAGPTDSGRNGSATLGAALAVLERACPGLTGTVIEGGRLGRHFRLSLNGRQFVSDPAQPLADGDTLVVLSAEVGG